MTNNPWKYFFFFYFRAWTAPNDDVALIFAEPTQVVIDVLENLIKKFKIDGLDWAMGMLITIYFITIFLATLMCEIFYVLVELARV